MLLLLLKVGQLKPLRIYLSTKGMVARNVEILNVFSFLFNKCWCRFTHRVTYIWYQFKSFWYLLHLPNNRLCTLNYYTPCTILHRKRLLVTLPQNNKLRYVSEVATYITYITQISLSSTKLSIHKSLPFISEKLYTLYHLIRFLSSVW